MTLWPRRRLILILGERAILAAEAQGGRRGHGVGRSALFVFPEGASLDQPVALGQALRRFLRAQRFGAARAVAGIPARWLLVKEKSVPPAEEAVLTDMLRLEAESDFATPSDELVLDCTEVPQAREAEPQRSVLVVAMARKKLEALRTMAEAAGLRLAAVTPAAMALAQAQATADAPGLYLGHESAELVLRCGGRFRLLRHVAAIPQGMDTGAPAEVRAWAEGLAGEVGRLLALLPRGGGMVEPQQIVVWDDIGLSAAAADAMEEALGLPVKMERPGEAGRVAASALAGADGRAGRLPVNFLRSRLAVLKKPVWRRKALWAGAAAVVVLAAASFPLFEWWREEGQAAELRGQVEALRPQVEEAQTVVDRVLFARGWQDQRPRFLECLREVALAFPAEGRIWTNSLAVREDLRGLISGRSSDNRAVFELLGRLMGNPAFAETKLVYLREAGGGRDVTYAISFTFVGGKPAAAPSSEAPPVRQAASPRETPARSGT